MNSLSRSASRLAVLAGVAGALLFWLLDAASEKFVFGMPGTFLDILFCPLGSHEFRTRMLATAVILLLVSAVAVLLRRKENSEASLRHGRFLVEEMAVELKHNNQQLLAEIDRRKEVEQRLENLADTDQLTGVYNRRKFDELLNLHLRQEARYRRGLCLLMLDIDYFKAVNDQFGHAVGDEILKELARLIDGHRREADSFFRIGGEEFCMITFASSDGNLKTAAEKIRQAVAGHEFGKAGRLTISIGATAWRQGDDYYSLFKRADAALYEAKQAGRDRVMIANPV
jgi:diguanylate cyclase (GGDEF)-like protein